MKQKKQCGVAKHLIPHGLSGSLLKKLLAVELSNSIKLTNSPEKNDELPAFLDSRPYWEYQQWEEQK